MSSNERKKRVAEDDNKTGREKRRAKNQKSRQINTGPKPVEFRNTLADDAPRLPDMILAEEFTAARIQEINAMQAAIKSAGNALNTLTFQSLPRTLRRRTASYNISRLPARLRARAAREMAQTPPAKRKVRRGKRRPKPKSLVKEYLRRQKENKWLETHIWHTKRMAMANLWGYRLALHPNMKSARMSYRAFQYTSFVHDASYISCIELAGTQSDLVHVLNTVTDASMPSVGSARFTKGNRMGHALIYDYMGYPTRFNCPATFLWKPEQPNTQTRALWLWVHPSARNEVCRGLQHAIESESTSLKDEVHLEEVHDELVRFDLSGPHSTALLQAVMTPVDESNVIDAPKQKSSILWRDLQPMRSSSSLPSGVVIGLNVQDPRLAFPQKIHVRKQHASASAESRLAQILVSWPDDVAYSPLWEKESRKKAFETKKTDYALGKRREEQLLPGTKLQFTVDDNQVPVLLIQRGTPVVETSFATERPKCNAEYIDGWTVIVPRGWGMAFWRSFVFAGARIGGLEDVHSIHHESGLAHFPHDFAGCPSFENVRQMAKHKAHQAWLRRPPGKRLNYEKLGVTHPFEPAFEVVTGGERSAEPEIEGAARRSTYYLLQGNSIITAVLSAATNDDAQAALNTHVETMLSKRGLSLRHSPSLNLALFKIRLTFLDRGKPEPNAMIYLMSSKEDYDRSTYYLQRRATGRSKKDILETQEDEDGSNDVPMSEAKPKYPPSSDLIGYLTTAKFSFNSGCGFGLGACSVSGIRRAQVLDKSQGRQRKLVVWVRNVRALECRPAQVEILA